MTKLISLKEFKTLRLNQFTESEITILKDWEFMDHFWSGEAIGFTEFLCLAEGPDDLGHVNLDLVELPKDIQKRILSRLGFTLSPGDPPKKIGDLLGKNIEVEKFVSDRETLIYQVEPYRIECTFQKDQGLIYLSISPKAKKA